ncbi:MAG: ABC transporter ATP-binding protein [Thaumarchaeota archaeon]|nr:ABC transporter ATP-binding protein [Nitrososphaerota archaeon]
MASLLEVSDLTVNYNSRGSQLKALNSVTLSVKSEEFLAVVGESGCGKTTLGLSIIGLLPPGSAWFSSGSIAYKGVDLASLRPKEMRNYRGSEIAMIFQEPLTSLNPLRTVGFQLVEAIKLRKSRRHKADVEAGARSRPLPGRPSMPSFGRARIPDDVAEEVEAMLSLVRIADAKDVVSRYPFELSGGMRQRAMIAMALAQQPALLIADEPTTALDVTTQAQVLKLMKEIKDKLGTTIILVTHDLAVASQVADRVIVMYAGRIVEDAGVFELFSKPLHPYTQGLLSCIPKGDRKGSELSPIPGSLPDLRFDVNACRFQPRCKYAMKVCSERVPPLFEVDEGHKVACFLHGE